MATLNSTVNFEDLFDFSPEPLSPPQQQQHQQLSTPSPSSSSTVRLVTSQEEQHNSPGQFAASESSYKVTPFWASNSSGQFTAVKQGSEEGDDSLDQLLRDLPSETPTVVKGKRGRKPGQKNLKTDMKSKLERSRQSARECRARKKLRYQYLDDLILERERANMKLRVELQKYQSWCHELDKGIVPEGLMEMLKEYQAEGRPGNVA